MQAQLVIDKKIQKKENDIYQQAVVKTFSFLKETTRYNDLVVKAIEIKSGIGYIIPICKLHLEDPFAISILSKWRRENQNAYPTRFEVSDEGTLQWVEQEILMRHDRILFFILDRFGKPVGQLGFSNCFNGASEMELDNVVKGEEGCEKGILSQAVSRIIEWAMEIIGPKSITLRLLSDNSKGFSFFKKLNFEKHSIIPLQKVISGQTIKYQELRREGQKSDLYFIKMVFKESQEPPQKMILTAGPSISQRELSYGMDAIQNGWNGEWSKYIKKFEESFAKYLGVKYAITTSSCTGALHLALLALGIGPGDEVIVPDITWVATANAVMYTGAVPIFADIKEDSWCLDPESFKAKITSRTKAVIPVHLYGHPAKMDEIVKIARSHGLYIVEDAAPAIGAEFNGKKTGTFGDFSAFSFQGAKLAVTGEGGMLVTDNDTFYKRVLSLWDQGRTPGTFWINELGWKYKMSNVQAAIGLGQLERVDELIEAKRKIFGWYFDGLGNCEDIVLNRECDGSRSIYWMTSVFFKESSGVNRDQFCNELKKKNVDSRPVFPAISTYPFWPKKQEPCPIASRIGNRSINLPSGVCLTREKVFYVCQQIKDILRSSR